MGAEGVRTHSRRGQEPGASQGTIGGGEAPAEGVTLSGGPGLGIDSGVGGLY